MRLHAFAVCALTFSAAPQGSFLRPEIHAGEEPRDIVLADFDVDGLLDIAIADLDLREVRVFLGEGQGRFAPPSANQVFGVPVSLAAGDLNADGVPDLVVAHEDTVGTYSTLLADGRGGFSAAINRTVGARHRSVALADFDRDGHVDAALAGRFGLHVLRGDGAGGFAAAVAMVPGTELSVIISADLDGDGWPDLAVSAPAQRQVYVFRGTAAGFAAPSVLLTNSLWPSDVAAADLDADGDLDLAVTASSTAFLFFGDGAGGFGPATKLTSTARPHATAFGDVDLDGRVDLLQLEWSRNRLAVLRGDGQGGFADHAFPILGSAPAQLATGDLDLDGRVDVVVANTAGTVSVLMGGGATFTANFQHDASSQGTWFEVGDLNADGVPDLAGVGLGSHRVVLLFGDGRGGFEPPVLLGFAHLLSNGQVRVGDFDADGHMDVVSSSRDDASLAVYFGSGGGAFEPPVKFLQTPAPLDIAVEDLNRDGCADLVVVPASSTAVTTLAGDCGRTFVPLGSFDVSPATIRVIALADLDGDGTADLVAGSWNLPGTLAYSLGDGSGGFRSPVEISSGLIAKALALGDVTGDGRADLVTASSDGGGTHVAGVFAGGGAEGFRPPKFVEVEEFNSELALGDLDADGRSEIVYAGRDRFFVLEYDLHDGYRVSRPVQFGWDSRGVVIADLDLDGRSDLAVSTASNAVSVFMNQGLSPSGLEPYGEGTAGCTGTHALSANRAPVPHGLDRFSVTCTNAPPNTVGLLVVTDVPDRVGSTPLGQGIVFHVDTPNASVVRTRPIRSDASGFGWAPIDLSQPPFTLGTSYYAQAFWRWPACAHATARVSSSRGLELELGP